MLVVVVDVSVVAVFVVCLLVVVVAAVVVTNEKIDKSALSCNLYNHSISKCR